MSQQIPIYASLSNDFPLDVFILTNLGLNPTINPFNHLGDYRNVFRSLQYARSDMYYCNRARHIIIDASLHVETLVKIILSKHKLFKFIYNRRELGKNIEQLYKENIISYELYERLNDLKKV